MAYSGLSWFILRRENDAKKVLRPSGMRRSEFGQDSGERSPVEALQQLQWRTRDSVKKKKALLWDIRRFSEPTVELSKHEGPVKLLHLDRHKIVTGGPYDSYIKVWETDTGEHLNSLISSGEDGKQNYTGCSTMAVDSIRGNSLLRFRDFMTATWRVPSGPYKPDPSASKF
ncbi:WD repeat-containing protein 5 homolog [Striga asiatica]|uniref:WD repeat-containing protein 5 homolog n=1 Tax=Striga asiatica TaxID=4170 RepID=A0A5A7QWI3_STRAF|nr:WD repeat-containing protein 5 homolog [Striga asiatica]